MNFLVEDTIKQYEQLFSMNSDRDRQDYFDIP